MGKILEKATQTAELLGGIRDDLADTDEQLSTAVDNVGALTTKVSTIDDNVGALTTKVSTIDNSVAELVRKGNVSISFDWETDTNEGTHIIVDAYGIVGIKQWDSVANKWTVYFAKENMIYCNSTNRAILKTTNAQYNIYKGYNVFYIGPNPTAISFTFGKVIKSMVVRLNDNAVLNAAGMFSGCTALESLDLSGWKPTACTTMEGMFEECTALESLDLSGWNTSNVTNTRRMFYGITLAILDLSSFDFSNVTNTLYMFGKSKIDNLIFGIIDMPKVSNAVWFNDAKIGKIEIHTLVPPSNYHLFWAGSQSAEISELVIYNIPDSVTSLNRLFYTSLKIYSIDISAISTANVTDMAGMFAQCKYLTTINVSNFDTANVTNMSIMFSGCSGLTTVDVSNFNTSSVTSMSSMFSGCSGLTALDLSNFVVSQITDIGGIFANCTALHTLKFPNMGMIKADGQSNASINFTACPLGTAGEESRQALIDMFSYDRTANGLTNTLTVQLSAASKALLTAEEIAAITAKGYTIA